MAETPEARVKRLCKKELKRRGIWYYMPVTYGMGVVGIPDILCCWHGLFIGIETKAPGKRKNVTPNQQARLREIRAAGGVAVVVDSVEDLIKVLDYIERRRGTHGKEKRAGL